MVEQRSPKPRAEGSSPSAPAKRQLSPTGLSCFFVRASRRRTSNPKDLAFALCKVLTGTSSGAKIVQQSFCPCQKVSQSFWIGLFFLSEMNPRHAERAGQESRLPPAAGGRRDSWRSSQRRQRRAGAAVGFGNCKRACEASSSPSAPAKRQFSPVGLSCFFR